MSEPLPPVRHVYPKAEEALHQLDGGECDCGVTVLDRVIYVHRRRNPGPFDDCYTCGHIRRWHDAGNDCNACHCEEFQEVPND